MLDLHNEMQLKRSIGQSSRRHTKPLVNLCSHVSAGTLYNACCCALMQVALVTLCSRTEVKPKDEGEYWKRVTYVKVILYCSVRHNTILDSV